MNATELATLSMSELKAFCTANSIEPVGDKRSKANWISAIEPFQSEQTVIEMPVIPDPFEVTTATMAECHSTLLDLITAASGTPQPDPIDSPSEQRPAQPHQKHSASIVMLVPLIMLFALLIVMGIGFRTLTPLIASVGRLSGSIWHSIPRSIDTNSIPIDYFPA